MLKIIAPIFSFFRKTKKMLSENIPAHTYRLISINKNEDGNYLAEIQLVNKSHVFTMKPEEILANDKMTDSFSQRDVRTLTYLGYLDINSPKYEILAKRLSEHDNKLLFAIKERGKKKPIIRTADQIALDEVLISGLHQKDAHLVGFTAATEHISQENLQKKEVLKALENNDSKKS